MPLQYIQSGTSVGEGFSIMRNNTNFIATGATFANQTITFTAGNGTVFTCAIPVNSNGLSAVEGEITQSSTPNQYNRFSVSALNYFYSGAQYSISATTVILSPNATAMKRYDAIVINTATNTITTIAGTPAAPPLLPALSSSQLIVGAVEIKANSDNNDATDFVLKYSIFEKQFAKLFVEKNPNDQYLDDLQDVVVTAPTNNQFLRYNGASWVNTEASFVDKDVLKNSYVDLFSSNLNGNSNMIGSVSSTTINSNGSIIHSSEGLITQGYKNFILDANDSYINGNNNIIFGGNSLTSNGFNNILYAPHNDGVIDQSDTSYLKNLRLNGGIQFTNTNTVTSNVTLANDRVLTIVDNSASGITVSLEPTSDGQVFFIKAKYANDNTVLVNHASQNFYLNVSGSSENKGRGSIFVYESSSNLVYEFGKDSPIGNVNLTGATFTGGIFATVVSANTYFISGSTPLESVLSGYSSSFTNGITNISGSTYGLGGNINRNTQLTFDVDDSRTLIIGDGGGNRANVFEVFARADVWLESLGTGGGLGRIILDGNGVSINTNEALGGFGVYGASLFTTNLTDRRIFQFPNQSGILATKNDLNFTADSATNIIDINGKGLTVQDGSAVKWHVYDNIFYDNSNVEAHDLVNRTLKNSAGAVTINYSTAANGLALSNIGSSNFVRLKNTNVTTTRTLEFPNASGRIALSGESLPVSGSDLEANATSSITLNADDGDNSSMLYLDGSTAAFYHTGSGGESSNIEAGFSRSYMNWEDASDYAILATSASGVSISTQAGAAFYGTLRNDNLTEDRVYQLPNNSGILALTGDFINLTGATLTDAFTLGGESNYQLYIDNTSNYLAIASDTYNTAVEIDNDILNIFGDEINITSPNILNIESTEGGIKLRSYHTPPSSSGDTGEQGEIRFTSTYLYYCISANTWVRAALNSW